MRPLGSAAAVSVATLLVFGFGWAIFAMNGASVEHRAGRSIGIERNDETAGVTEPNADSGHALPSNPHESSFGTLQPDGTYCGVFCSENH